VSRRKHDIGIGTNAVTRIIDVEISYRVADTYVAHAFPMALEETRLLRDMLTDAIEHVEAGGHGAA
jgi:hypothetical protein